MSGKASDARVIETLSGLERRDFLKTAAMAAATGAITPSALLARQLAALLPSPKGSMMTNEKPTPSARSGQDALSLYVRSINVLPAGSSTASRSPPLSRFPTYSPKGGNP